MSGFEAVLAALCETDPQRKCALVAGIGELGQDELDSRCSLPPSSFVGGGNYGEGIPGRPQRPALVDPRLVPRRGFGSVEGRAALVHAIAHIEFNAVNLALDACWRFRGLPLEFYSDWLSVARDEARHFQLLAARLAELGFAYGDFEAHNGLWDAAERTRDDVLARMALVPRVLEARGLDVTPGIIGKLRQAGDVQTVAVLEVILAEEVRHVAIGTRWFHHLCRERGLEPDATFRALVKAHGMSQRPPYNLAARSAAGFSPTELAQLSVTR